MLKSFSQMIREQLNESEKKISDYAEIIHNESTSNISDNEDAILEASDNISDDEESILELSEFVSELLESNANLIARVEALERKE